MLSVCSTLSRCQHSKQGLHGHRYTPYVRCTDLGAVPGETTVSGATWLQETYGYTSNHLWRNFGIIVAFLIFFTGTYLIAVEFISPPDSRGEVLVFPMGKEPKQLDEKDHATPPAKDEEDGQNGPNSTALGVEVQPSQSTVDAMKKEMHSQRDIFTWRNVCCDVRIKNENRRLLSNVSGYVKPGTLTALMGESGAGKTTLLDTYPERGAFLT
jgi:ATP-binding cassette, subfamily G (WHITE), member 2, PDR